MGAQRRRRGVVLQHGSILLGQSPAAPELLGLAELAGKELLPPIVTDSLAQVIADALNLDLSECDLSASVRAAAAELSTSKYGTREWSERR